MGTPALAKWAAMRAPMVPAPRTATLWMRSIDYLGGTTTILALDVDAALDARTEPIVAGTATAVYRLPTRLCRHGPRQSPIAAGGMACLRRNGMRTGRRGRHNVQPSAFFPARFHTPHRPPTRRRAPCDLGSYSALRYRSA